MPKTKSQKQQIISALSANIKGAKSVVVADCTGLTVAETQDLRRKCQEQGVEILSAKKTLLGVALKEQGVELDSKTLKGSLSVATSKGDEVAPAKIIKDFAKKHEQMSFQAGLLEGKLISAAMIMSLANLPSKLELLAKAVGSMQAPISGFVRVLAGNLTGLVRVLDSIKNNKS